MLNQEYVLKDDIEGEARDHIKLTIQGNKIHEEVLAEKIGSEKKKLIPTEMGKITNDFLVEHFRDILEYNFTAKVETQFDDVAMGKKEWTKMITIEEHVCFFSFKILE